MTTEQKFRAAVNVIRNLPKHGPVQTPHHVMLKFYAYFKQATEGPNNSAKPAFWDLVKRAKWDAWTKLGNMKPESAMEHYVDEFKKIVESVSESNANVDKAEVDNFYASVPMDDFELLVGPVIARSRSNSPVIGEMSNVDSQSDLNNFTRKVEMAENKADMLVTQTCLDSIKTQDDEEDEEYFLDTIENSDNIPKLRIDGQVKTSQCSYMNGCPIPVADGSNSINNRRFYNEDPETNFQLTQVITCLQRDLEKVVNSVSMIEQHIGQLQGKVLMKNATHSSILSSPIVTLTLLITWPVLLQLIMFWFRQRNR